MARIDEIGPDVFRICAWEPQYELQFNHFLVRDDEPLLFHTGYNQMFNEVREAAAQLLDLSTLRWIGFSHFESDECGSLNRWLELAPRAQPVCTFLAAALNVNDFAVRQARGMPEDEVLKTGKYAFRFYSTQHLPHGWDAGVLFEETQRTLFCSDLLFQFGAQEPLTERDIVGPARESLKAMQAPAYPVVSARHNL